MNPDKDLINQIQNPDLRIIAQILLDIRDLMESEVWHRELHLVGSSKVKPRNVKVVLKPDLESRKKYADAVYIYEDKDGKVVARIVEAKSSPRIDPDALKRKYENTQEYVERAGYKVDRYEWVLSIPKHLEVPPLKGILVVKNPKVEDADA